MLNHQRALLILGLKPNFTNAELKKAYRRMAKENHPDVSNGDDKKFKDISEAYKLLKSGSGTVKETTRNPDMNTTVSHGSKLFEYEVL